MQPVQLPSKNFYVSVDRNVLDWAMERIGHQFLELLESGAQAEGIPPGVYAAGQHLIPFSRNQRGLYGTAAALLVLARSEPSLKRIEFIEGLIRYVNERPSIEEGLARTEEDRAFLKVRLLGEGRTAFKCAEMLYALAAAPAATSGRETLLKTLLDRVGQGRRAEGGWAADLDPTKDHDALATASVVRGLHAVGVAVGQPDLRIVRADAEDGKLTNRYVRTFCLLVLLEVCGSDQELSRLWGKLFDNLHADLRDRSEANYEFALGNRQEWVRIPWQLYLISSAAICRPWSIVLESDIRRSLLNAIRAVDSAEGYIYPAFGHMKSTRTYSILMDCLWTVRKELDASRLVSRVSAIANVLIRIVYSRSAAFVALLAALGAAALAVYEWIARSPTFGAVGPEILAATLLGVVGFFLSRVNARRN